MGDDLSKLNQEQLKKWLSSLQNSDGSFNALRIGSESDCRFVFSAAAVCFILQDFSCIDVDSASSFIKSCYNPLDGGFGLCPGQESHGGATYTAVAALRLLGTFDQVLDEKQVTRLVRFCVSRQVSGAGGFCGRINKDADTCYAFWVGATLQMLGHQNLIDRSSLGHFLDTTFNSSTGGYGKTSTAHPDPLHSHFGVSGRILSSERSVDVMEATLGMSRQVFDTRFDASSVKDGSGNIYSPR